MSEPILVVDDNAINLRLMTVLLSAHGYEVWCARDADETLRLLSQAPRPRLVLLDLRLPGMDGLQLTRKLKADPATRDLIIVAVTASAMKGDEALARAAGCDGYVTKPVDTRAMIVMVQALLGR